MRITDVFCDLCKNKTSYSVEWKRPNFIERDSYQECMYPILARWGYKDLCVSCFDLLIKSVSIAINSTVSDIIGLTAK